MIAFRNVVRQRRRAAAGLGAVAFGVVALLVAGGFIEWIFWAMREDAIRSRLGHIQVTRPGYIGSGAADPFAYLLPDRSPELERIEQLPGVVTVAPRLAFSGLASLGDATLSFIGEGVVPDKERELSRAVTVVAGENLSADEPSGVLLGEGLAANLGAAVGDPIILLVNTQGGGVNAVEGRVRGLFATPSKAYDDAALRVTLPVARQLLRTSGAHTWAVLLDATERTDAALATIRGTLAGGKLEATPWRELADFYNKTVALFSRQVAVMKGIIGLIIILSISNTLMMAVMERTGEIGTSMALGTTRRGILLQFVSEGAVLGLLGGLLGVTVGLLLAQLLSLVGIPMPPPPGMARGYTGRILVTGGLVLEALALAVATALVASLYPAWKASRMKIVDALRHNR
ncbi:MAG: FtsX-like permease family protein [Burkholderiales bacterium]|nr:FtsX-like permease family protein [Burkholderiales bacterium]